MKASCRTVPLFLMIFLLFSGCGEVETEPCYWQDVSVLIVPSTLSGKAPQTVHFNAYAKGFSCGCCGGKEPTQIVEYRWDLDNDGINDMEGSNLTLVEVTFEDPGVYKISVCVIDTIGYEATDSVNIEVLEAS